MPSIVENFSEKLVAPLRRHPFGFFLLFLIVLFSLFAGGAFIFSGGILPVALGFLSFLAPVMAPFLVSTALSITILIGLPLALVSGAYLLDALIDALIPSKSKGVGPSTPPPVAVSTEVAVKQNPSNTILNALGEKEKSNERVVESSGVPSVERPSVEPSTPLDVSEVPPSAVALSPEAAVLQNPSAASEEARGGVSLQVFRWLKGLL